MTERTTMIAGPILQAATNISRRKFMGASALTTVALALGVDQLVLAQDRAAISPKAFIDIHCHIFNAQDLPIEDFIVDVITQGHWLADLLNSAGLLPLLRKILIGKGKTVEEEMEKLKKMKEAGEGIDSIFPDPKELAGFLQKEIESLVREPDGPGVESMPSDDEPMDEEQVEFLRNYFLPPVETKGPQIESTDPEDAGDVEYRGADPATPKGRGLAFRFVTDRVMKLSRSSEIDALKTKYLNSVPSEYREPDNSAQSTSTSPDTESTGGHKTVGKRKHQRQIEDRLIDSVKGAGKKIVESEDPAVSLIAWGAKFNRYRVEQAADLSTAFKGIPRNIPKLYAPSLTDFQYWLGKQRDTPASLVEQRDLMEQIALLKPNGQLFHGYYPFDPVRALLELSELAPGSKIIDTPMMKNLIEAVENRGFLGAKVYPPMGFRPIGNAQFTSKSDFGKRVRKIIEQLSDKIKPSEFGRHLDDALLEFYRWCVKCDVPILTHTSPSQFAFEKGSQRPDPRHWQTLLEQGEGKEFKNLRVNLGHLGGAWCLGKTAETEDQLESNMCAVLEGTEDGAWLEANTWTGKVLTMFEVADQNYPNLYADISDLTAISNPDESLQWTAFDTAFRKILGRNKNSSRRILYGTDWIFLGKERGHPRYYQKFLNWTNDLNQNIPGLGPHFVDHVFWKAAADFSGILKAKDGTAPKTRLRLEKFHKRHNNAEALALLEKFDWLNESIGG